jgi:hypothetical protein
MQHTFDGDGYVAADTLNQRASTWPSGRTRYIVPGLAPYSGKQAAAVIPPVHWRASRVEATCQRHNAKRYFARLHRLFQFEQFSRDVAAFAKA